MLFAGVSMAWAVAPAHGHAVLTASTPTDGASLEQPPAQALLTFNEALDPALSVVRVLDASGTEVEVGETETHPGPPAQLQVALGELAQSTPLHTGPPGCTCNPAPAKPSSSRARCAAVSASPSVTPEGTTTSSMVAARNNRRS